MCWYVFESLPTPGYDKQQHCLFFSRFYRYFLAKPKSITLTWFPRLPKPIKKLSGLISRWMKFFEWMNSMRRSCNEWRMSETYTPTNKAKRCRTSWSASISTVFSENFRLQKLNKSSRDGPSKSITMTL